MPHATPTQVLLFGLAVTVGSLVALHQAPDFAQVIDDAQQLVATGAAVLELDYKVDMPVVKAATKGRATVLGPIDPSAVMALGTPDDVRDAARQAIDILGVGGGLILGPGCALPPATPPDNIHALIEAARTYGSYR